MVDYDPFEDARAPLPTKHAKEEHSKATTDSEPSGSPLTPSAVGPDPIGKPHEGGWESLDGPVYFNTSVRNEDGNTRYVNHFINAKPEDPKHNTVPDENLRPNGPLPMMGIMPEPLPHHQQVNYIDNTKTACADCANHNKSDANSHHDNVFRRDFKSLTDKVAHLEKELGVTILHLVHEGQTWARKAHPHPKSTEAEGKEKDHELDLTRVGKVPSKNHPRDPGSMWVRMAETSPFF